MHMTRPRHLMQLSGRSKDALDNTTRLPFRQKGPNRIGTSQDSKKAVRDRGEEETKISFPNYRVRISLFRG